VSTTNPRFEQNAADIDRPDSRARHSSSQEQTPWYHDIHTPYDPFYEVTGEQGGEDPPPGQEAEADRSGTPPEEGDNDRVGLGARLPRELLSNVICGLQELGLQGTLANMARADRYCYSLAIPKLYETMIITASGHSKIRYGHYVKEDESGQRLISTTHYTVNGRQEANFRHGECGWKYLGRGKKCTTMWGPVTCECEGYPWPEWQVHAKDGDELEAYQAQSPSLNICRIRDLDSMEKPVSCTSPHTGALPVNRPRGAFQSRKDKAVKYCRKIILDSAFTAPHIIDHEASYGQFLNRYVNVEEMVVTCNAIRTTEARTSESSSDPGPRRWRQILYNLGRLRVGTKTAGQIRISVHVPSPEELPDEHRRLIPSTFCDRFYPYMDAYSRQLRLESRNPHQSQLHFAAFDRLFHYALGASDRRYFRFGEQAPTPFHPTTFMGVCLNRDLLARPLLNNPVGIQFVHRPGDTSTQSLPALIEWLKAMYDIPAVPRRGTEFAMSRPACTLYDPPSLVLAPNETPSDPSEAMAAAREKLRKALLFAAIVDQGPPEEESPEVTEFLMGRNAIVDNFMSELKTLDSGDKRAQYPFWTPSR
jgi:hypothetical protein